MTDEDIIDCIMEIDRMLLEAESALQTKKYKLVQNKLDAARAAIEDLRQEDSADDVKEIEMNVVRKLK
jgi:hypothetical protein